LLFASSGSRDGSWYGFLPNSHEYTIGKNINVLIVENINPPITAIASGAV
jgi:hypothetical protein